MTVTFVTLDPAHFHAALVHKEMLPGVARRVHIYAPPGPDIEMHLDRMNAFQSRKENPTEWELQTTIAPDFLQRFLHDRPGTVVVLAGRNRTKIDAMLTCVEAGYHVLADKPWIVRRADFPKLERLLELAAEKQRIVHDIMTERFEITSILQRELVRDRLFFGTIVEGTLDQPAVRMESVHALKKSVAGKALRRPVSFFDIAEQGDALADVGTHLVDLVQWTLFPEQVVDPAEIEVQYNERWPTPIAPDDFREITGASVPAFLARDSHGNLLYPCNNRIVYRLRGVVVELIIRWDVVCPTGDTHFARYVGTNATVEVRQAGGPPKLYASAGPAGTSALFEKLGQLSEKYPGLSLNSAACNHEIIIPDSFRTGHEAHFREVAEQFLKYVTKPEQMPGWEVPNLLSKYSTTINLGAND